MNPPGVITCYDTIYLVVSWLPYSFLGKRAGADYPVQKRKGGKTTLLNLTFYHREFTSTLAIHLISDIKEGCGPHHRGSPSLLLPQTYGGTWINV